MNAVYRATCLAVCLAVCHTLVACGNKGDLYLEQIELSAEQKAVLDGTDVEELKKNKKKKLTVPSQTTE